MTNYGISPAVIQTDHASGILSGNASANTKGAWVELIASTANDVDIIDIEVYGPETAYYAIDIGIGAAASEVVIIPDLTLSASNSFNQSSGKRYKIPIAIPAGTRVAARMQGDDATGTWGGTGENASVGVSLYQSGLLDLPNYGSMDALNFNSATTGPANTTTAKTAWIEITSSMPKDASGFFLDVLMSANRVFPGNFIEIWAIALGAAAAEQEIWREIFTCEVYAINPSSFIEMDIPAGTRVSFKRIANVSPGAADSSDMGAIFRPVYR